MMTSNNLNWHNHGGYTKMTAPSLNVNATDKDESKRIIMHKTLSENCSADVSKSKRKNRQRKFIAEQFRGRIRVYYYGTKRQIV